MATLPSSIYIDAKEDLDECVKYINEMGIANIEKEINKTKEEISRVNNKIEDIEVVTGGGAANISAGDIKAVNVDFVEGYKNIANPTRIETGKYYRNISGKINQGSSENYWCIKVPVKSDVWYSFNCGQLSFCFFVDKDDNILQTLDGSECTTKGSNIFKSPSQSSFLAISCQSYFDKNNIVILENYNSSIISSTSSEFPYNKYIDLKIPDLTLDDSNMPTSYSIISKLQSGEIQKIGNSRIIKKTADEKYDISGLSYCTFGDSSSSDNNILKEIEIYGSGKCTVTCQIGTIDQNNLLVATGDKFTLDLEPFWNVIDVSDKLIKVPEGSKLFIDLGPNYSRLWKPINGNVKDAVSLISDSYHKVSGSDYSGMEFYESEYIVPFSYKLGAEDFDKKIERIDNIVSSINTSNKDCSFISTNFIKSPDGTDKRIYIDNEGNLKLANKIPSRMLFIGNSLMFSTGGLGMCASEESKDYVHQVSSLFKEVNSNFTYSLKSGVAWEGGTPETRKEWTDNLDVTGYDIVSVQLCDNVNDETKRRTYEEDGIYLINKIRKKNPSVRILLVAGWFTNDDMQKKAYNICKKCLIDFADIHTYNTSENRGFIGMTRTLPDGTTETVTAAGVAAHPADGGMKLIAEKIFNIVMNTI